MKQIHKILMLAALAGAALPASAMPIGLRTAVWGVSGANGRAAVGRLLPDTDSTTEIKAALNDFSDKTVAANITDNSTYEEFREWALESGARADTLAASSTAWLSFATGSPVLGKNTIMTIAQQRTLISAISPGMQNTMPQKPIGATSGACRHATSFKN